MEHYDALTLDEFKEVFNFIQVVYRAAHNEKDLSGNHGDFGAAVGGKEYILYLHHCLIELGDKGFESSYSPKLREMLSVSRALVDTHPSTTIRVASLRV